MKTRIHPRAPHRGLSLVEVVGVMAVIAFLAAILTHRIMEAVEDARAVGDVSSINNISQATKTYYQKYGTLGLQNGQPVTSWVNNAYDDWDVTVLMPELMLERNIRLRLATNSYIRLVRVSITASNVNILSNLGTVGSLTGFNSNNGYYNLTQDYAWAPLPGAADRAYAEAGGDGLPSFRRGSGLAASFGGLGVVGELSLPWADDFLRPVSRGARLLKNARAVLNHSLSRFSLDRRPPMQACYPVPTGWPVPNPPAGYSGSEPGSPSHSDPGADSQIYAPNATTPRIVAELVLEGVTVQDAYRLSLAIDGASQSNWAYWDSLGRVKYDMYNGSGGTTPGVAFVYLGHK